MGIAVKSQPHSHSETASSQSAGLPGIFCFAGFLPSAIFLEIIDRLKRTYTNLEDFPNNSSFFDNRNQLNPSLFFISLETREDILGVVDLITEIHKRNWHWHSQVIIISGLDHQKLCSFFVQRNCMVISRKFSNALNIREQIERQISLIRIIQSQSSPQPVLALSKNSDREVPIAIHWKSSLLMENDLWFVPLERFVTKFDNEWTVMMLGPNPLAGDWTQVTAELWKWTPKSNLRSVQAKGIPENTWFFRGKKPQYNINSWNFRGEQIALYSVSLNEQKIEKFKVLSHDRIEIAPNSSFSIFRLKQNLLTPKHSATSERRGLSSKDFTQNILKKIRPENPTQELFRPIDDLVTIYNFLSTALKTGNNVLIWKKRNPVRITGSVSEIAKDVSKFSIQLSKESIDFLKARKEWSEDRPFYGNFNIDLGCVFFSNQSIKLDQKSGLFTIFPDRIFFHVQRRKHTRFKITPDFAIKATIPKVPTELVDISQGGIGIKLRKNDYDHLKSLTKKELILKLDHHLICCELSIQWARSLKSTEGDWIQTGLKFKNLSELDQQAIQLFLFEQNLKNAP